MIVPMKRVSLIVQNSRKKNALRQLRKLGVVHVDEIRVPENEHLADLLKTRQQLDSARMRLQELVDKKNPVKGNASIVEHDEFPDLHAHILYLMQTEQEIRERKQKMLLARDRLLVWGDFSPADIHELAQRGVALFFYRLGKKELAALTVPYVTLFERKRLVTIAVIGSPLGDGIVAERLEIGDASLSALNSAIDADVRTLEEITRELASYTPYLGWYRRMIASVDQEIRFERIASSMQADETVAWLLGYIPVDAIDAFTDAAPKNTWGYLIDDPSEEEQPPTLLRNKRWISIIEPVFDILGTIPGYREYDISMWFLLFFTLFFAMIVGDAAYGVLFLLVAIFLHRKTKQATNALILLYVLSIASIIWGAVTGTWFGSEAIIASSSFLQHLVIPRLASYPELFGLSVETAQQAVMRFCFIVGTLQLSLACVMNIYRKIGKKDISAIANVGWLVMIDSLYFLVLMLVINEPIQIMPVIISVGIGFVLVVLFSAQGPGIPFLKGLAGGAAGLFTTFLNSISTFSNIISYIRLFAVGMASLAISQSFNSMASGMLSGFALPAGILVLVLGHSLNLVMALLSVIVHGVRLNLLEFSGQLGMEWTGVAYDPFRETVETTSHTL